MSASLFGSSEDRTERHWEADLAQGAVADRIAGTTPNLKDVVIGSELQLIHPDGTAEDMGGGAGDISAGQVFAAQSSGETDEAIQTAVAGVARSFGLDATEIKVLRPLGPAVSVVVRTPARDTLDGKFTELWAALAGEPSQYEGLCLEIDGPDGSPLVRQAAAFRTGSGELWFADGIDDEYGIPHGINASADSETSNEG
jgi:hypothetical protein